MSFVAFLELHSIPFLLVLVRTTGIFLMTPIFSAAEVPYTYRAWVAATIALVLYPSAAPHVLAPASFDLPIVLYFAEALAVGLLIGLILQVYYTAFLLAGEFYSLQMGFGIVNVMDPLSEASIPILGQVKSMFALLVFTVINGHHMVIESLAYSFQAVPALAFPATNQELVAGLIKAAREMFLIAFQIAAPIIGTVFLIELVMGIMSKVAPQLNVMEVGFQVKIVTGLTLFYLLLPDMFRVSTNVFSRSFRVLHGLLNQV